MKLVAIKTKGENEQVPMSLLAFGKKTCQSKFRGWYGRVNFLLPILRNHKDFESFQVARRWCQPVLIVQLDKVRFEHWKFKMQLAWHPLKEQHG